MNTLGLKGSAWTLEEDTALARALHFLGMVFNGPGLPGLKARIQDVRCQFLRFAADYRIDSRLRTPMSLGSRVKELRRRLGAGLLHCHPGEANRIKTERYELLKGLFLSGPPQAGSSPRLAAPMNRLSASGHQRPVSKQQWTSLYKREDTLSQGRRPAFSRVRLRGRIEKQSNADVKRLLNAWKFMHRKDTDLKIAREENIRRQQQVDLGAREWNIDIFWSLLQACSASGDGHCPDFLQAMQEMKDKDTELSARKVENIRGQIESDRKTGDKERGAFREVMNRFL